MPNDRQPTSELQEIIAAADKFASRTNGRFIVSDEKQKDYVEFSESISKDTRRRYAEAVVEAPPSALSA